jgi:hypothetical protein
VSLEHLWAGWRHDYIVEATERERAAGVAPDACVFCRLAESGPPSLENLVVIGRCLGRRRSRPSTSAGLAAARPHDGRLPSRSGARRPDEGRRWSWVLGRLRPAQ